MIVYFLRHASAGQSKNDPAKDDKRALDDDGIEQCGYIGRALAALDKERREVGGQKAEESDAHYHQQHAHGLPFCGRWNGVAVADGGDCGCRPPQRVAEVPYGARI